MTSIPNRSGTFTRFDSLSVGDGTLVFAHGRQGIYRLRDGQIESVVDTETTLADGSPFFDLRFPTTDEDDVVFWGRTITSGGGTVGLYRSTGGEVGVIVDSDTIEPAGSGSFSGFGPPVVENGHVAFQAETDSGEGVYSFDEHLRMVVDTSIESPNNEGLFQQFSQRVQLSNGNVLVNGKTTSGDGIYLERDGLLEQVVDEGSANFRTIADFTVNGGGVIFRGIDENGSHGIYDAAFGGDGFPSLFAGPGSFDFDLDVGYPFPRSSIALASEDGVAVMANTSDGEHGIFWFGGNKWTQIAKSGEHLDGAQISHIEVFDGHELSGSQLGFVVNFEGSGQAVYLANVPEPSSSGLFWAGSLLVFHLLRAGIAGRSRSTDCIRSSGAFY